MPSLRKWLFSGLLVLVPLIITLWVLEWVVSTLDQTLRILPTSWQPDQLFGMHIPGLGVVFALVVLLSIGMSIDTSGGGTCTGGRSSCGGGGGGGLSSCSISSIRSVTRGAATTSTTLRARPVTRPYISNTWKAMMTARTTMRR